MANEMNSYRGAAVPGGRQAQNPPRRKRHNSPNWVDRCAADICDLNRDYHDFEGEVARTIAAALAWRPMDGISLIAAERERQKLVEGWTPEHDNQHDAGEMAVSAARYALHDTPLRDKISWQWESCWWKPKDPIRNLVRAGALIAAEIDRRQRADPAAALAASASSLAPGPVEQVQVWECGCGAVNGVNLTECGVCRRHRSETRFEASAQGAASAAQGEQNASIQVSGMRSQTHGDVLVAGAQVHSSPKAASVSPPAPQWRPIESADPQMTRAILYWPTFALDENMEQTSVRVGDGLVAEGFRVGSNAWESNIVTEHFEDEAGFGYGDPTHFMAFPDPPASSSPTASAKGA